MLGPELLVKMRGIVEAKKAAIATADSRVIEAVSKITNLSAIFCYFFREVSRLSFTLIARNVSYYSNA
jgi:hypothetical protein